MDTQDLFAGNFSLRKGAPAILKVVKMLKNELNVQFDIIGGIDHSIQLLHSDELHLVDRVYGVRRSSMVKYVEL